MITEQQKFWARICTFDNKRCTPENRQVIACKAIRDFLWHLIPEISHQAIEAVELLARGVGDKKRTRKLLHEARTSFSSCFESRATIADFAVNAFSCANTATFMPLSWSNFYHVFDNTVRVLTSKDQQLGRLSKDKRDVEDFTETIYAQFNDFIEPFLNFPQEFKDNAPSKVRPPVDYFSPLFNHPRICADGEREWAYFSLHEKTNRQIMFNALDAWDAAAEVSTLTLGQLEAIVLAAKHSNLVLRRTGLSFLILLSQVHEPARLALLSLLDSKKAVTRWQCITHIDYYRVKSLPPEFIERIIRKGLNDKLPRTRQAAAGLMMRYQRKDLLSQLEHKLAAEGDAKTVECFQFAIPLVRDGYFLKEDSDGQLRLTRWTPYSVGSQPIARHDATPENIKRIIAEESAREAEYDIFNQAR